MGLGGLLGDYGSEEEGPLQPILKEAGRAVESTPTAAWARDNGCHGCTCDCESCGSLVQRFAAKNLQTKGIRFKCKLCTSMTSSKAAANRHFQQEHPIELQAFKRQKQPHLFDAVAGSVLRSGAGGCRVSFAREDVLRKRPADIDDSFGGWAKKEKPEPPPCQTEEYQAMLEPVFTAPPWANKSRPSDDDATEMDKEVDRRVQEAQQMRFSRRNILEITHNTVRCKLCYSTLGSAAEAERHIGLAHRDDFQKEMQIWERFLYTTCRRQPPFGWVCKVCNIFFPSDAAVWRHLGKEVFIRHEERHLEIWHQKEDRWGHEEDEECCGDGMNYARGLSYESVRKLQEEAIRLHEEQEARDIDGSKVAEEDEEQQQQNESPKEADANGQVRFISEF